MASNMDMEPNSRQRLRPWLVNQLNIESIPGLKWLPNDKGVIDRAKFRIPWKHGGKHDWTPDQSRVFKEWATHTGKYREGVDDENFAKWKTNLRCALNKAADIQEIAEESQKEAENPFKVYKFLPRKSRAHPVHKKTYTSTVEDSSMVVNVSRHPCIPRHIESYSSSDTSLSKSMSSGGPKFAPMHSTSIPNSHCSSNRLPSDLDGLKSDSLRDVTDGMTSLDKDIFLKEEVMDCDDDEGLDKLLNFGQSVFTEPEAITKHEATFDPADNGMYPSNGMHTPMLFKQQPLMGYQDQLPAYHVTNNPLSVGRNSEASCDNSSQACFNNPVPSPQFSQASSPYSVQAQYNSPQPSPQQMVTTHVNTAFSPPSHHYTVATSPLAEPRSPLDAQQAQGAQHQLANPPPQQQVVDIPVSEMADMNVKDGCMAPNLMQHYHARQLQTGHNAAVDIGHICHPMQDECSMVVTVLYRNKEIITEHITDPAGCIIAYNPLGDQGRLLDNAGLTIIKEKVYDQKPGRIELALPEWGAIGDEKLDREVVNLLKNAGRGIVLECVNGDIFAKRLCKTSIYYATHFDNESFAKINRHEESKEQLKIFDYHNVFEPAVLQFGQDVQRSARNGTVKHPNPDVYLFVGQNGTPSNAHTRYVVIKISSCKASKLLRSMEKNLYSLSAEVSHSDSLDVIDGQIRIEISGSVTNQN